MHNDFNLTSTKDMYNVTGGNKAEFIKKFQSEYKTANQYEAEKWFNYMASMDTDGTPGLTPEEHQQGLNEKKDLAEIKRDKIYSQYIKEGDEEMFAKMSQDEKLAYLEKRIPHEPDRDAEAHIQASIVLSGLNRIDNEIELLNEALDEYKSETNAKPESPEEKAAKRAGNDYINCYKQLMNLVEEKAAKRASNDYLKSYIGEEALPKFNKMTREEQIEYLKTHIAHTPDTTDEELETSAYTILHQKDIIEKQAIDKKTTRTEIEKQLQEIKKEDREAEIKNSLQ